MKCETCKIDYPDDLVSLFSSTDGSAMVCGICALEMSNELHVRNDKTFHGEIAESLRLRALAYRRKHGHV